MSPTAAWRRGPWGVWHMTSTNCFAQIFNNIYILRHTSALDELSGTVHIESTESRAQRQLSGVRGTDAVDHHAATRLLRALQQRRL